MALLFFEGFDKYASAAQMLQQANYSSTSTPTIVTTSPRTGRASLDVWSGQNARFNFVATGAAWTPATVNALSAGVERIL